MRCPSRWSLVAIFALLAGCAEQSGLEPTGPANVTLPRPGGGTIGGVMFYPGLVGTEVTGRPDDGWLPCLMTGPGCRSSDIRRGPDGYARNEFSDQDPVDYIEAGPVEWFWCIAALIGLGGDLHAHWREADAAMNEARYWAYMYDAAIVRLGYPFLSTQERAEWTAKRILAENERDESLARAADKWGVSPGTVVAAAAICAASIFSPA